LPTEQWDEKTTTELRVYLAQDKVDRYFSTGPDALQVPNVIATLAHHPKLAKRFLAYNYGLLYASSLDARLRELVILRVAWRTRSTYEWVQHAARAPDHGITPAEIDALGGGAVTDTWSQLESAVLAATDQMIDTYRIDDDTWSRLAKEFDERQMIELTFVIGTYTCLAMAFNSFGLQVEPELQHVAVPAMPAVQE
jgi:alkylhydroperoxidase family enzyme